MRKSLLAPKTPTFSSSNGIKEGGRCTDFVALVDHADLADTSKFNFTEHVNRDGLRVFEMSNSVNSNVRHIGTEDPEDGDYDYCVAFFNRRTKKTEYKPISFLRVAPRNKKEVEESGLLEGRQRRSVVDYAQNLNVSKEEYAAKREELTTGFGNIRKRKVQEANKRQKIDASSMSIMNESLIGNSSMGDATMDASGLNSTIGSEGLENFKDISLLQTPESIVVPKMNMTAKSPEEVFKLEDFFASEELPFFKVHAKTFFATYPNLNAICSLGVPKFIVMRALEAFRRSDLCAAAALKLVMLGLVLPRGRSFATNVTVQSLSIFTPQINQYFESDFLHGRLNREKKFSLEKLYKQKMITHTFAMYFALSSTGNYNLPLSVITNELQYGDSLTKPILQSVGCSIQPATNDEMQKYSTAHMARFVGPIRAGNRRGGQGRGRIRIK